VVVTDDGAPRVRRYLGTNLASLHAYLRRERDCCAVCDLDAQHLLRGAVPLARRALAHVLDLAT